MSTPARVRSRLIRPRCTFSGYTNADGTRKEDAPVGWPFGTVAPTYTAATPRVKRMKIGSS